MPHVSIIMPTSNRAWIIDRAITSVLRQTFDDFVLEARVVIGDFKVDHNRWHRHSALGYLTPAEYAAACTCIHHPVTCGTN